MQTETWYLVFSVFAKYKPHGNVFFFLAKLIHEIFGMHFVFGKSTLGQKKAVSVPDIGFSMCSVYIGGISPESVTASLGLP